MPISIIGAGGDKLVLITENKLDNEFNDFELEYTLLKDKYLSKCNSNIIDKVCYNHLLNQLANLFVKTDDIDKLVEYINKRSQFNNLYDHTKLILKDFDILHHLHKALKIINNKLKINSPDSNFINNVDEVINILYEYDNQEINNNIDKIQYIIELINFEIIKLKHISINNTYHTIIKYDSNKISNNFINDIKLSLDEIIDINNKVNTNIKEIINLINQLTDILTQVYLQIPNLN